MSLKNVWRIVLFLSLLFGLISQPALNVQADEPTYQAITCLGSGHNPCQVMTTTQIEALSKDAEFWGLYLKYGNGASFKYGEAWAINPNPAEWSVSENEALVPDEIHLPIHSFVSLPQMGIFWWNGTLKYDAPGKITQYVEVPIPTTNPAPISEWSEITNIETPNWDTSHIYTYESYSWDGSGHILTWEWVPEIVGNELVIHIMMAKMGVLTLGVPAKTMENVVYQYPANLMLESGERLKIVSIDMTSWKIPASDTTTLDDIKWYWKDEISSIVSSSVSEETAWMMVQNTHKEEIAAWVGTVQTYENTNWRATQQYVDSLVFERENGEQFRVKNENLMIERGCTKKEGCYSTSYTPNGTEEQYLYVLPYSFWNDPKAHPEYSALWLTNIYPGVEILDKDMALLNQRWLNHEITSVEGTVKGPVQIGNSFQIGLTNGTVLELPIHRMPPVGSKIRAYIYKNMSIAPHGDTAWPIMALFEIRNGHWYMWFYNTEAEYGEGFNSYTYGN